MRQMLGIFIICVLFVFGIRPGFGAVSAQAETPVEAPALPLVDVNGAADQLIALVNGLVTTGVNAAWFAPIVALFVGLLKSVPALYKESPEDTSGVSAPTLSFAVSTVIWVVAAVVTRIGVDAQFNSLMDLVVQTAPYMFGFLATIGFAPKVHEYAASVKAPVLGSKRSPEKAVVEAIPAANLAAYQPHIVTTMSAELDEATILRIANQAAVAALDRVGFNWSPEKPAAG
jgi:hypothetical protein